MADTDESPDPYAPSSAWTEEFKAGLAEACRRDAELDRQLCEEFKYVDAEALGPDE